MSAFSLNKIGGVTNIDVGDVHIFAINLVEDGVGIIGRRKHGWNTMNDDKDLYTFTIYNKHIQRENPRTRVEVLKYSWTNA